VDAAIAHRPTAAARTSKRRSGNGLRTAETLVLTAFGGFVRGVPSITVTRVPHMFEVRMGYLILMNIH